MDLYTFAQRKQKSANHMKFLPYIFLLCCGLWSTISFADGDYIEYRGISSNNRVTLDPLRLSNKELRWLASKKNLVIASTQVPNSYVVAYRFAATDSWY